MVPHSLGLRLPLVTSAGLCLLAAEWGAGSQGGSPQGRGRGGPAFLSSYQGRQHLVLSLGIPTAAYCHPPAQPILRGGVGLLRLQVVYKEAEKSPQQALDHLTFPPCRAAAGLSSPESKCEQPRAVGILLVFLLFMKKTSSVQVDFRSYFLLHFSFPVIRHSQCISASASGEHRPPPGSFFNCIQALEIQI